MPNSEFLPTFAFVFELERHIEILLLNNDCVVVPGLGGFIAHHICAHYEAEEGLFLPPLRTLGFNAKLVIDDSLLAHSYVTAYDISLPDAADRIEQEVAHIKQLLDDEGKVELNNLGSLYKNNEGHIAFAPIEAGILTPSLYGLSSFEMKRLTKSLNIQKEKPQTPIINKVEKTDPEVKTASSPHVIYIGKDQNTGQKTLNISLRALRNVAVAAVFVGALFAVSVPLTHHNGPFNQNTKSGAFYNILSDTQKAVERAFTSKPRIVAVPKRQSPKSEVLPKVTAKKAVPQKVKAITTPALEATHKPVLKSQPAVAATPTRYYSIVLCSQVSRTNAEAFVHQLAKEGIANAEINEQTRIRKVTFGRYKTAEEAQQALNNLRSTPRFQQAWVIESKSK